LVCDRRKNIVASKREGIGTVKIIKFLYPLVLMSASATLINRLFSKPTLTKPVTNDGSYAAIDAYIEVQMRRLNIPGVSLAIVEGDQIVHLRGFGRARPGGGAPTPQTPFFIGSLTKSFTALAVMQLVEAGKVELGAPVQGYLPWFRVADPQVSAQITVRHLLNQTSGLPLLPSEAALADFDDRLDATERQVRALSTLNLTRPVGSKFEYSNTNYNILGLIVEAASSRSYSEYLQEHIFDPLDMSHSFTSKAVAQQNGLAMGHRYWFGRPVPAPNLSIPRGSLPSGQLISSAEDMADTTTGCRFSPKQGLLSCTTQQSSGEKWAYPLDTTAWVGSSRVPAIQGSSRIAVPCPILAHSWPWYQNRRRVSSCSSMPTMP
jgi:CubicO group peptidase (beta-lactamase class C family)